MLRELPQSFYRRPLPSNLIPFASKTGKQIFKKCLDQGRLEGYFGLAENFITQQEPAFCGLGTLAMCLNALEIDPGRSWKGVWRWYTDEMLECCTPISVVKERGTTCLEFACLGKCNGLDVVFKPADKHSIEEFKNDLIVSSTNDDQILVVSFDRQTLNQTGEGHYSPIGSYLPENDQVLVLDVARFKYPSYWVSADQLFKAMNTKETGQSSVRGYFLLSRFKNSTANLLTRIIRGNDFIEAFARIDQNVINSLQGVDEVLNYIIGLLPTGLIDFEKTPLDLAGKGLNSEFHKEMNTFQNEILSLKLYKKVKSTCQRNSLMNTILILSCPLPIFDHPILKSDLLSLVNVNLSQPTLKEILKLRRQILVLDKMCMCHWIE